MNLEPDFRDFVQLLTQHEVDYLVVGGYALAFHGKPRFTGDLDIWIDCTEANAKKMVSVMKDFGTASLGFTKQDFLNETIVKQIGQPPLRIDILGAIDGVKFTDAVKDKQFFKSGNLRIPFIGITDFIKNKEAVGRARDLADVEKLKPKVRKTIAKKAAKRKGSGL
jgi:hypothetical protein